MFSQIKYVLLPILAIYFLSGTKETAGQGLLNPQVKVDLKNVAKNKCRITFNDEILEKAKQAEDDAKSLSHYNNEYPDWDENAVLPDDNCHHYYFMKDLIDVDADQDDTTVQAYFSAGETDLKPHATVEWIASLEFARKKTVGVADKMKRNCILYNYHGYSFYHKMNDVIKECLLDNTGPSEVDPFA